MKGAPESQPDLLLFLQEKYRRAIPVASQRAAAQSTSAVHSAAMTVTRHSVVYDNFNQRSPRPKCYYNNYASLSMSDLLLPVAAATGTTARRCDQNGRGATAGGPTRNFQWL
jgi:hypothetical protein